MRRRCDDTDTESTSEDDDIGGHGVLSHGNIGLTHQHYIDQLISAGAFSVHNTEAAEAHHKLCMALAALRVRHLHDAKTKSSMLRFLYWHYLFEDMQRNMEKVPARKRVNFTVGVQVHVNIHMCDTRLLQPVYQRQFLHAEALITRYELLDLLCDFFEVPRTRQSYSHLRILDWVFGQKFIREDGLVLWATDTKYPYGNVGRRRDVVRLAGTETVDYAVTALCCEAVLFVSIRNCQSLPFPGCDAGCDVLDLLLGRYFSAHRTTHTIRDDLSRPVCPGPLHLNHCLWTYSRSARGRASVKKPDGTFSNAFNQQRHLFGRTVREQREKAHLDSHAYYCLVDPSSICNTVHMCPQFVEDTSTHDYSSWLQTVTLI